jgi:hypothetical protein
VGVGMVTVGDRNIPVRALVEGIHSSDFSKQIFFEGNDKVEATTRQFVLWDEEDNFYMIDQSHVTSHTPEYPSHTWLLYKNATDGYTKKGFTSDVVAQSFMGRPETGWTITAPEFYDATIKLSVVKYINDGDYQTRMRPIVQGTITDNDGTRTIRGFGFIIR